ncbi:diguanylate cyclase domain-containing protein [Salinibius halmophilus]|uniref:diguanylate cyclase domain-containing protein n=1 Tax=Salinibius halmophilus TaxID=1853216 RepID=UPI000E670B43|nr:GGDEF domain-containing protein [Salinibius halmophilus]
MEPHLALIIDDVSDGYQAPILAGVNQACRELKVPLRTYCTSMYFPLDTGHCNYGGLMFDLVNESDCLGIIVPAQIYLAVQDQVDIFQVLRRRKDMPLVVIGNAGDGYPSINLDNHQGVVQAMQHFILDHGIRRIAMINGPMSNLDAKVRFHAYQEQLRHYGIAPQDNYVWQGTFHFNDGKRAVDHFHTLPLRPQAIMAADDYMALGALNRARELNWSVKVIGFDNIEAAALSEPPLTTIEPDLFNMGREATFKLFRRIRRRPDDNESLFSPKLVIRNSCGCSDYFERFSSGSARQVPTTFKVGELQMQALALAKSLSIEGNDLPQVLFLIEKSILELRRQVLESISQTQVSDTFLELLSYSDDSNWLERCRKALKKMLDIFFTMHLSPQQALIVRQVRFQCMNEINRRLRVHQQISYDRLQQHKRDIDEFCQAINTCFSTIDLVEVLKSHSVIFELGDFAIGVYKSNRLLERYPSQAPKWSTVIFDRLAAKCDQSYSIATAQLVNKQHSDRLLVMPLSHKGIELGYMVVSYQVELLKLYSAIAFHLGFALKNIFTIKHSQQDEKKLKATLAQLRGANAELAHNSVTDELTGLLNRRGFHKAAEQHWRYSKQQHDSFIIGYADLDGLKQINDSLGHEQGDLAIWAAGQVLQNCFRRSDIVARLAGDEFAFLLIDSNSEHVIAALSKIQHFCHEVNQEGFEFKVSMSVGFAVFDPDAPSSLKALLNIADAQLYDNKVWKKENQLQLPAPPFSVKTS